MNMDDRGTIVSAYLCVSFPRRCFMGLTIGPRQFQNDSHELSRMTTSTLSCPMHVSKLSRQEIGFLPRSDNSALYVRHCCDGVVQGSTLSFARNLSLNEVVVTKSLCHEKTHLCCLCTKNVTNISLDRYLKSRPDKNPTCDVDEEEHETMMETGKSRLYGGGQCTKATITTHQPRTDHDL